MNGTKEKSARLLALFMAAILVLSSLGSVAALAGVAAGESSDCNIASYTLTSSLTENDKSSSTQQNYQRADLTEADYTTSLLQSAEWTDKTTGEAKLNIHYEADFSNTATTTRSLYVFTSCTYHSFTEEIAITNIIELLDYNEYVDVIMIGTTNSTYNFTEYVSTWNITAASMFSLKASDFADYESGLGDDNFDTDGNYTGTATNTKAAMIAKVLETYLNSSDDCTKTSACSNGCTENNFADIDYAYALGSADTSSKGSVEVLYDDSENVTYPNASFFEGDKGITTGYNSAAELALTFGGARHAGVYFSLYYIAQYIDIIENNYGSDSFSSTVRAIFNSFDSFNTAYQNSISIVYVPNDLYDAIEKYIGLDMKNSSMSLSDMQSSENGRKCWNALSVLKTYSAGGRYIALVPDSGNDSYGFSGYAADGNYGANVTSEQTENMLLFALTLMAPSIVEQESEVRNTISSWVDKKTTVTIEEDFRDYSANIYGYSKDLSELDILQSVYTTNSVTITTTITSEFKITDTSAITVVNSGDKSSYFSYDDPVITPNSDGTTTVSINFYDLSADNAWAIDISIPVVLKDDITDFRTSEDRFKDTNGSGSTVTTANVTAVTTTGGTKSSEDSETVTVASPKLYRATGLIISKTVSGDGADSEQAFTFVVTLLDDGTPINGTYEAIHTGDATITSVTFDENGQATFTLTDGQSITITDLPAGVSYTVEEEAVEGYTTTVSVDDAGFESVSSTTGTIISGQTTEIAFNNHKTTDTETTTKTDDPETPTNDPNTTTDDADTTTDGSLPTTGDTTNPRLSLYAAITSALAVSAITSGIILRRRNRYQGAHFRRI